MMVTELLVTLTELTETGPKVLESSSLQATSIDDVAKRIAAIAINFFKLLITNQNLI